MIFLDKKTFAMYLFMGIGIGVMATLITTGVIKWYLKTKK